MVDRLDEAEKALDNARNLNANLQRNVNKMKDAFAEEGLLMGDLGGAQYRIGLAYEYPMGQPFKETRTDLDASISGAGTENLVVVEVIKPIIRAMFRDTAASLRVSFKKASSS